MPSAYLQWRFHSGERIVARGPLVMLLSLSPNNKDDFFSNSRYHMFFFLFVFFEKKIQILAINSLLSVSTYNVLKL